KEERMTPTVLDQRAPAGTQHLGRRRASPGQGTAEFALCAPIARILLLGIVEAGFLMFGVGTSAYATGEAARVGAEAGNAANGISRETPQTEGGGRAQTD